jgi:hypothetical protein
MKCIYVHTGRGGGDIRVNRETHEQMDRWLDEKIAPFA